MKYYLDENLKIRQVVDEEEFKRWNKHYIDVTSFPNVYELFERQERKRRLFGV